jgi:hypothetical protein
MRINCENGFYFFETETVDDPHYFEFIKLWKLKPLGRFYTFENLAGLPVFSIEGQTYGNTGLKAAKTICGDYGSIFKANDWVFNLRTQRIDLKSNVSGDTEFWVQSDYEGVAFELPQAGAKLGGRVINGFIGKYRDYFRKIIFERIDYDEQNNNI